MDCQMASKVTFTTNKGRGVERAKLKEGERGGHLCGGKEISPRTQIIRFACESFIWCKFSLIPFILIISYSLRFSYPNRYWWSPHELYLKYLVCFLNKFCVYIWHFKNTCFIAGNSISSTTLLNQFAEKAPNRPLSLKFYCHLLFISKNCNKMREKELL